MASADGVHHVVHNGEIYNFQEVRSELSRLGHTFRSGTDTEVISRRIRRVGPVMRGPVQRDVGVRPVGR